MDQNVDELVNRVKRGDEAALSMLFEKHRARLTRMVQQRLDQRVQSRVSESDIIQEAFLDLTKQLPNYAKNPELPFFLWLRRITGQRLAKVHQFHLGRDKRSVDRENLIGEAYLPDASSVFLAAEFIAQSSSPSRQVVRNEEMEIVQEAIEKLAENDREVIAMRHGELLTNEEIAILLGISINSASMRYTRAIIRLKDRLKGIPGLLV